MPIVDADVIRKLITIDDSLFVSDRIAKAIGQTTVSGISDILDAREQLIKVYKDYVKIDEPTPVSYSNNAIIDAYTVHYLPRNTLIPKLLFLSLAYHPTFQTIKDEINILDLGSGTGGVTIGLLDLFEEKPLRDIKVNIVCCDFSILAMNRQTELLKNTKYQNANIKQSCVDLANINAYDEVLSESAPYDYIIAANLLAELPPESIKLLISELPTIMAPNSVLLFADPPRTYIDKIKIQVSDILRRLGLSCYYPCPPDYVCPKSKCQWVWLNFEFTCPDIETDGELLETNKQLSTTWSIYSNSGSSIYDILQQLDPALTWGVAVPYGNEFSPKEKMDYNLCTPIGRKNATHTRKEAWFRDRSEVILRGSILGFNADYSKVCSWHPLYGFDI